MCDICMHSPCLSGCPNAPDPTPVTHCCSCGEPIIPGDEYGIIDGEAWCEDCLEDQCYGGISKRTLENAAIKGSAVHNSIENWIKFGIDDIPSEHRGYFNGFMEWWKQYKPRVFGSEVRIYHKLMRYGGTIDLLCEIGGLLELIDFKTTYTLLEMACGVQLEAYSQALISHGITPQRKHILHLKKDGKWSFREFPAKDPARCRVVGALKCLYDYEQSYK